MDCTALLRKAIGQLNTIYDGRDQGLVLAVKDDVKINSRLFKDA